jgi:hypothetical protein
MFVESDLQRRHSIMTRKMPEKLVLSSNMSSPLLQSLRDAFTRVTSPTPEQTKVNSPWITLAGLHCENDPLI